MKSIQAKKAEQIAAYNPSDVGVHNGNFMGLPFDEETADLILLPIPFDATVSFGDGTALGSQNILEASPQLDVGTHYFGAAWKKGIYMKPISNDWLALSQDIRPQAKKYIAALEAGEQPDHTNLVRVNEACTKLHEEVYQTARTILSTGKLLGLVGGDHSTPLGFLRALQEAKGSFGVLQIDAHCDLRVAYEGFTYSHASIFYNAKELGYIQTLTQVGIRDFAPEEEAYIEAQESIYCFKDAALRARLFEGKSYQQWIAEVIDTLPEQVYISFDIDGLSPNLCPNTGTPVPGGFSYAEAEYLLAQLAISNKKIIGFDLSEVAGDGDWDGNVGARVLYLLSAAHLTNNARTAV